jgi:hypothetical protein
METTKVIVGIDEATRLYREYKKNAAYSEPIDWEIQRCYQLLSQKKVVIKALESVANAGVDDKGLPKLAIASATAKACRLERFRNGAAEMSWVTDRWRAVPKSKKFEWRPGTFEVTNEMVGTYRVGDKTYWNSHTNHIAQVPLIPIHLRPKRALQSYHILWEAEWAPAPPRDPYLLRRIGKADLWLVVAHWDLTEVERGALATRVVVQ